MGYSSLIPISREPLNPGSYFGNYILFTRGSDVGRRLTDFANAHCANQRFCGFALG
jgi:hypothetical protein